MSTKRNTSPRRAARNPEQMSDRAMRKALRELAQNAKPSLPAKDPQPARWISVRQAAQWRREIARDRAAGKPLPDFRHEGVLTLRRLAEHEWGKLNDICIMDDLSIARIVGVAEDDDDFYYVCERLPTPGDQARRTYWSAVCNCTSLRGRLDAALYEETDAYLSINGCKPVRRMQILRKNEGKLGPRVVSREPINMTGRELLEEIRAVARGEREGPRARGKTRRK